VSEHFTAGRNAPLTTRTVRFTATAGVPLDVCAFVVDDRWHVSSPADAVFYNQPATPGVRLEGDTLLVDPAAVRPGARVLCAVGAGRSVPVTTTLADAAGGVVATFHVEPTDGETALLCWEIYRRGDAWKIRALGQGYTGGLERMFTAHGVEVDGAEVDGAEVGTPTDGAEAPAEPGLPPLELLWRIFEDAARSAAACTSTYEFAQQRLDDELSAAVADPADRTGPAAERRRERAEERYRELVDAADERYRDDSAVLTAELLTVDATLPPALASWSSPSWSRPGTPSDGVRVGEVWAPDLGALRIPLCLPAPLIRPLWLEGDPAELGPVVSALTVRLLAACPGTLLHLIDPARSLPGLTSLTAPLLAGPPVLDSEHVAARLRGLAEAADLDALAQQIESESGSPAPLLVVLGSMPHGYGQEDLIQLLRLVKSPANRSISVILAGEAGADDDPIVRLLREEAECLPGDAEGHLIDPWTGGQWTFTPDRLPTDTELLRNVVEGPGRQDRV